MNTERHHYIPKYFIEGFADKNNKLWIYDKSNDEIGRIKKSPKQIFYEWNLNTIQKNDVLEDTYSKVDSYLSTKIKKLINDPDIDRVEDDLELITTFLFFMINIFWRNPTNENAQMNSLEFLRLDHKINLDHPILTSQEQLKLIKLFAPFKLIKKQLNNGKWRFKILDNIQEFVLSDNPIIFKKLPISIDDFVDTFVMPLSKSRVFIGLQAPNYNVGIQELKTINLLSTFQAGKYVASSSKKFLEQIVIGYKHWKQIEYHLPVIKNDFFETINKITPDNK